MMPNCVYKSVVIDYFGVLQTNVSVSDPILSREASNQLTSQLGIPEISGPDNEPLKLSSVLSYLSDRGTASNIPLPDMVKALILTPGCGYYVSGLSPVCKLSLIYECSFYYILFICV